jgi:hypothetical protein
MAAAAAGAWPMARAKLTMRDRRERREPRKAKQHRAHSSASRCRSPPVTPLPALPPRGLSHSVLVVVPYKGPHCACQCHSSRTGRTAGTMSYFLLRSHSSFHAVFTVMDEYEYGFEADTIPLRVPCTAVPAFHYIVHTPVYFGIMRLKDPYSAAVQYSNSWIVANVGGQTPAAGEVTSLLIIALASCVP